MGMILSFTRVTPEELDQVLKEPESAQAFLDGLDRTGEPEGDLDKTWAGIQFLLDAARVPVFLHSTGELIDEDGRLCHWSVGEVEAAAEHLRATPFDQLARHYDPARMTQPDIYPSGIWERDDDASDYLRAYYQQLVRFFDAAAGSGSAVVMSFSF